MDVRLENAKNWRATCEVCDKTFGYPDFDCPKQSGAHSVPPKTYYHLGAGHIQNMRERQLWAPLVNLRGGASVRDKVTGQITELSGVIVQFGQRGIYETSNPEEQYYLDLHPAIRTGATGKADWEKMFFTTEQQLRKAQGELDVVNRQIREGNALLDTVRSRQQGKAASADVR